MWWWDKQHPLAVYMDRREEPKGANPARPNWHIKPDVLGDFRAMPFHDGSFHLVLFDPPHIVREKPSGIYPLYFGALQPDTEQEDLGRGFTECWRVLAPGGTLVFKWAGKLDRVEPHFPATPIVGNRIIRKSSGLGVRWIIFYKPLDLDSRLITVGRSWLANLEYRAESAERKLAEQERVAS